MADPFFRPVAAGVRTAGMDAGLRAHMQSVFNYMAGGLVLTGLVAYAVAHFFGNLFFAVSPTGGLHLSLLGMVAMIAPIAMVFYIQFRVQRMAAAQLQTLFWVFCGLMGASLSVIFIAFVEADIARAFFITAADFAAVSLWGYTTRRSLSGMAAFMYMGLFGIIIAGLVNIFFHSSGLQWAISVITVIVFSGLTAYQMQMIKQTYAQDWGAEANNKMAVMSALSLYMSFINLFQAILSLTASNRN